MTVSLCVQRSSDFSNCQFENMWLILVVLSVSSACHLAEASYAESSTFRFANIYGDHMVLQMEPLPAAVWGFGEIGAAVTLTLNKDVYRTQVTTGPDGNGIWKVDLKPQAAGGPFVITATNGQLNITLQDVYFGDVWLCSGQSNMQFTVSQVINAAQEIKDADNFPEIRLFTAAEVTSLTPLYELQTIQQTWTVASSKSVNGGVWKYFSAVCWFYGKNLFAQYKRPIGLVATDWGGTPVEAWSSPDSLKRCNITGKSMESVSLSPQEKQFGGPANHSVLYNAMIHPFLNMTIFGAIWYQGEANSQAPDTYNCTFPAMIDDWRVKWFAGSHGNTNKTFPFGFVQLSANGNDSKAVGGFPVIRWAQTANYGYVPNPRQVGVFMAVAMDLGNASSPYGSVHPPDKQDVGYRLATAGRAVAYGDDVYFSGPLMSGVIVSHQEDVWEMIVDYDVASTGSTGLLVQSEDGFEFYCVDEQESSMTEAWVNVKIVATSSNQILLAGDCPLGSSARGLRYAWREYPCEFKKCAVYSKAEMFPAPPFVHFL